MSQARKGVLTVLALAALAGVTLAAVQVTTTDSLSLCIPPAIVHVLTS